jgi:hypothetical protein
MTSIDVIAALESLGYTSREAPFLYLVAVHSGYFLRRQFDSFINRQQGAISQNFLEKARIAGHIEVLDYGQKQHVYHLFFRPIYRLLGNADSQNRQRKGDASVRARLMALDYVLENQSEHFLASEGDKVNYFSQVRRVLSDTFLSPLGRIQAPLDSFPISVADRMRPSTSIVRFAFIDEGMLTTTKFSRFLRAAKPLFESLGNAEVIYIASSIYNFAASKYVFEHCFSPHPYANQQTLGPDWHRDAKTFAKSQIKVGIQICPQFTTLLFHYTYPKLRRKEHSSLETSRPIGLSRNPQATANTQDLKKKVVSTDESRAGATPP